MDQITDLKDLLKHEILDLYSAEEQIIDALPKMVASSGKSKIIKEALTYSCLHKKVKYLMLFFHTCIR
jgi:ferritin-like metal-binding protein YciE